MKIYFAPLEGITGFLFRNVFHRNFSGVDKFYAPFLSPGQGKKMTPRERKDICPENNPGIPLVPQILTNQSEYFLRAAGELKQMGYQEVNLNLGCPSGTVVAKNKGSGFLREPDLLDKFLYEIFEKAEVDISIKTRIGLKDAGEFEKILPIYNKYAMKELIIHPRLQKDMYRSQPDMEIFSWAMAESKNPLCYNGDVTTTVEYRKITGMYSELGSVMIGRGFLMNPLLGEKIAPVSGDNDRDKERIRQFHDELYAAYRKELSGEKNVLFKMKELWIYLHKIFTNGELYMKKIKKVQRLSEYEVLVRSLFNHEEILRESDKVLAK